MNIYSRSWRLRKAYWTTARVLGSYARLWLLKKFMSAHRYERRLMALHLRNAERVRDAILELKGLFIKLGQMLSVLTNFLPEAFQKPLEALQDQIPPQPFDDVRQRILREFGQPPEAIFARFDPVPLAAASIGQAHRAQLPDGTEVVVKVQHAHIEEVAQVDLEIIRRLVRLHGWFFDIKGMDYLYTQVKKMIEEELDFAREAAAMQAIGKNLAAMPGIAVPQVHPQFSTARVLTTTWHEGVKISQLEQLDAWKISRRELAARLLEAYCQMLFRDGFYHADPHPGNILVQPDGSIVLLDFGAVAALSPALREGIPMLIEAAVRRDTPGMVAAFRKMGFLAEGRDAEKMAEKMIAALRNFLENEVEFEGLNFKEIKVNPLNNSLLSLLQEVGMSGIAGAVQVPKDYVLLNRMLTLLLGLCNALDPALNPLDVVRPYAQKLVIGERENLVSFVGKLLRRTATTALSLPDDLSRTLQKAQRGELEMASPDVRASARLLYSAAQQMMFAVLLIAAAGFGFWLENMGMGERARLSFGAAALFALLWWRAWRAGNRLQKGLD